jgi:hypothetical protein
MARQHNKPYIVKDSTARALEVAEYHFDEAWLRDFIFAHQQVLPINEIEPVFDLLIPVCTELPCTKTGSADILFINDAGLLTLVECKLWKNPGARREVVAQILDYAKELSRWGYDDLQRAVHDRIGKKLYDLVRENRKDAEELDESTFNDSVSRNLKRGRFLLLIVGEGIRESVELIADFLQQHAHLNFTFALVEMGVFQLPKEIGEGFLVHPRLVTRTVEMERAVIRIEDGKLVAEMPPTPRRSTTTPGGKRTTITEQVFYENLDPKIAKVLQEFFDKALSLGIGLEVDPGQSSLMLKLSTGDKEYNLGTFRKNGIFRNYRIASYTERFGYPEIGEKYLEQLASLFEGGYVDKPSHKFQWTVKKRPNQFITIAEVLAVQDRWLEIIRDTTNKLLAVQET